MEIKAPPVVASTTAKPVLNRISDTRVPQKESNGVAVMVSPESRNKAAFSISAESILSRINEALGLDPQQIESFQNRTPESTAKGIVDVLKGLFSSLESKTGANDKEKFAEKFFNDVRSGIDKGYGEAFATLEALGAFEVSGVKQSVEDTRISLERQLTQFENEVKETFGTKEKEEKANI